MTVRDIAAHLSELYGTEIGRDTISRDHRRGARGRRRRGARGRWSAVYPIVYFDAMLVKVREDRSVRTCACYLALGVTCDGDREVLGIWWQETEGAKFWLAVLNDLHRRGVRRRPDRLRRRPQGLPRGDRGRLPAGLGADLHRPPDPRLACATSTTATARRSPPRCGRSTPPPTPTTPLAELERFDERVGRALPDDRRGLARATGSTSSRSSSLPDELRRAVYTTNTIEGAAPPDPQGDQDPRALPRRTGRDQADLPRHHQSRRQVAAQPRLDSRPRRPQDPLRRPLPRLTHHQPVAAASHTVRRTVSRPRASSSRSHWP